MRSIPDDGISSTTSDRSFEISAAIRRVLFLSAAALSSRVELLVRRSPGAPLRFRDGGAAFLDAAGDGRDEARVVAWAGASGASIVEGYAAAMVRHRVHLAVPSCSTCWNCGCRSTLSTAAAEQTY